MDPRPAHIARWPATRIPAIRWPSKLLRAGRRYCRQNARGLPGRALPLVLLPLLATAAPPAAEELRLIQDGQPLGALVLPAAAHADEALAAAEIRWHLLRMSGAELPVITVPGVGSRGGDHEFAEGDGLALMPEALASIRIGLSLAPEAEARIRAVSDDPAAFLLEVDDTGVVVAGLTPEGTLFAAYELLERLGVRWYMPGDLGTVIPHRRDVTLPHGSWVRAPSFAHRHLQAVSQDLPWYRRQRLGGDYFPGAHGIHLEPPADFATEPELFSLIDGERQDKQLCLGNPEVLRRAIAATNRFFEENPEAPWIGMGANDGRGFCEDDRCTKLDGGQWDPFAHEQSMTDRYIWFYNQILAGLDPRWADKRIAFYAYATYKLPPVRWTPDPRIVPALAPITLCRIHGVDNPVCPERDFYKRLMSGWGQAVPEVFERGYYFNLADPGLPFSKVHAIRDETPAALRLGVAGWRVECMPSWAVHTPTLYVAARLMWDADADVDALVAEFYAGFFGPAAEPMGGYLDAVDAAFRDGDCHTGGSHCLRRIFDDEDIAGFARRFDEAQRLTSAGGARGRTVAAGQADEAPYAERVRVLRMGFERLRLFRRMLNERDAFDFAAARATLDTLFTRTDSMRAYELVAATEESPGAHLLYPRNTRGYIERFWSPAIEAGHRATVIHGELAGRLPEEWDFLIDPDGVGESLGYYREHLTGGNWQRLHTSTQSWGDQGLHYYKGKAWYRARVDLDEAAAGDSLYVQFGGVDEVARVWLNGRLLGAGEAGSFKPFDLDATAAAHPGVNVLAVEITNDKLNELGTGGITAPVFLWRPRR